MNIHGIKPIALYLPQFHPIPENDKWWGKGFTEWTNVTKAKPLFEGHRQPRLPSELGFYDLRVPEVRDEQADLARKHGIYGFCYWHYWFGGRQILEKPLNEVVASGKPDFPFCIAWANQTWSGTWHGLSENETLIEQTYPGKEDHENHFYKLLHVFRDKRYIEVKGKKLVFIFRPMEIDNPKEFIEIWQSLAKNEGLKGFHFVAMHMPFDWTGDELGFDANIPEFFNRSKYQINNGQKGGFKWLKFLDQIKGKDAASTPIIASYSDYVTSYPARALNRYQYPWIMTDWDNTPRAKEKGWLFSDSTPELFGKLCVKAFKQTLNKNEDERFLIIRSWNEWAEGNYLEPDERYGRTYLEIFRKALDNYSNK